MPPFTIESLTDAERQIVEQAVGFLGRLQQVGASGPVGTVSAAGEQVALKFCRRLVRNTPAAALPARADHNDTVKQRQARG